MSDNLVHEAGQTAREALRSIPSAFLVLLALNVIWWFVSDWRDTRLNESMERQSIKRLEVVDHALNACLAKTANGASYTTPAPR